MLSKPLLKAMFRVALAITAVTICWLAFTSSPPEVATHLPDKLNHLAAFFALAFLLDYSFPGTGEPVSWLWLTKGMSLMTYAVGIECVQWYLDGRSFELLDLLADAMGVLFYIALLPVLGKIGLLQMLREPVSASA